MSETMETLFGSFSKSIPKREKNEQRIRQKKRGSEWVRGRRNQKKKGIKFGRIIY